jgi:hypothetical protein
MTQATVELFMLHGLPVVPSAARGLPDMKGVLAMLTVADAAARELTAA